MKAIILLALFMFGLVFGQNQHVDTTAVTLGEAITPEADHFLVSIDHIEDEIDINGKILAERIVHVALQFDVVEGQNVLVNGVPAPIGYSELTVVAAILEVDEEGQASPFDQIVKVDVRIFVGQRMMQMEDGSVLTGIYIQERVVGIQEKEVWQASVKEQVFIVRADGSISRLEVVEVEALQGEVEEGHHKHHGHHGHHHENPENMADEKTPETQEVDTPVESNPEGHKEHHSHGKCKLKKYWHKFVNWFTNLPFYLRLLVSFGFGLVLGFIGIAFMRCLCCVLCGKRKCEKKNCCNNNKEENYKKNIHLYSLQYTAIPQNEKDAEKKVAAESV